MFFKKSSWKIHIIKKVKLRNKQKNTNKNILIIGGGVAGLASAAELKRFGHNVTIYERHKSLGGMLIKAFQYFVCQGN